jgi:hypothetical protein
MDFFHYSQRLHLKRETWGLTRPPSRKWGQCGFESWEIFQEAENQQSNERVFEYRQLAKKINRQPSFLSNLDFQSLAYFTPWYFQAEKPINVVEEILSCYLKIWTKLHWKWLSQIFLWWDQLLQVFRQESWSRRCRREQKLKIERVYTVHCCLWGDWST